jgi:hypothetical protein
LLPDFVLVALLAEDWPLEDPPLRDALRPPPLLLEADRVTFAFFGAAFLAAPPFLAAAFLAGDAFLAPPFLAGDDFFAAAFLAGDDFFAAPPFFAGEDFLAAPPFFAAPFFDAPFDEPRPEDEPPRLDDFLEAPFLDAPFDEDLPPPEDLLPPFLAAAFLVDFAIVNGF